MFTICLHIFVYSFARAFDFELLHVVGASVPGVPFVIGRRVPVGEGRAGRAGELVVRVAEKNKKDVNNL